jgi:hypothetical protein
MSSRDPVATMATLERPVLVLNPRSDVRFASGARDLVDKGVAKPEDLQRRLRERYPRAIVHIRELSGESISVWYVYRDGRWAKASERGEGGTADDEPEG